ncbi:MAG: rane-associated zinc metalloprotease [Myxococcales bacterium]|nr:rane-associated zinc metalloprotease [Myxococcales bacterium]
MTLLWFALLIGVLITVHELGHFVMARLFGVRVQKLQIGFGRPLVHWVRRGTEFAVGMIPLGGYVRLLGEGGDRDVEPEDEPFAFALRPAWQRLAIIFAGPLANIAFAAFVFMQLARAEAGAPAATIGTVFAGQPAAGADLRPGDRVVSVDGESLRAWDEFNQRVLRSPGRELRISVERPTAKGEAARGLTKIVTPRVHMRTDPFGAREKVGLIGVAPYFKLPQIGVISGDSAAYKAGLRNFDIVTAIHGRPVGTSSELEPLTQPRGSGMLVVTFLRPVDAALGFASLALLSPRTAQVVPVNVAPPGKPPRYDAGVRSADTFVHAVEPATPAAAIGLGRGDMLTLLDGQPVMSWEQLAQTLDEHPTDEHTVAWHGLDGNDRHAAFMLDRRLQLDEYQAESTFYVFGAEGARAIVPVPTLPRDRNLFTAAGEGVARAASVTATLMRVLGLTLIGRLPATSIGGPILVYEVAGVAAQHGLDHFLAVAALISLNLGLLNLLPVPLLDGGQATLILLEAVRRRPVSARARERATLIGLMLLGALMLLALRNDLARHLSGMFK